MYFELIYILLQVVAGGRVRGGHRPRRRSAETNHPLPPTLPVAADRIRRLQPPPHPFRQVILRVFLVTF